MVFPRRGSLVLQSPEKGVSHNSQDVVGGRFIAFNNGGHVAGWNTTNGSTRLR